MQQLVHGAIDRYVFLGVGPESEPGAGDREPEGTVRN
jgi:hypothetical protein